MSIQTTRKKDDTRGIEIVATKVDAMSFNAFYLGSYTWKGERLG